MRGWHTLCCLPRIQVPLFFLSNKTIVFAVGGGGMGIFVCLLVFQSGCGDSMPYLKELLFPESFLTRVSLSLRPGKSGERRHALFSRSGTRTKFWSGEWSCGDCRARSMSAKINGIWVPIPGLSVTWQNMYRHLL